MPHRLSLRATVVLVALAFGLSLAVQALLSGGSSAAAPGADRSVTAFSAAEAGAAPDLELDPAGTVPALREPRQPRKRRAPSRTRTRAAVTPPPVATATPVVTATPAPPAPTPFSRSVAPAPRSTPKPAPAPTSPPPSGEFDTSGDG
jgi:hypothetical protein